MRVGLKSSGWMYNLDESAVYIIVEMKDPSFLESFGEQEEIVAIREAGGLTYHQLLL